MHAVCKKKKKRLLETTVLAHKYAAALKVNLTVEMLCRQRFSVNQYCLQCLMLPSAVLFVTVTGLLFPVCPAGGAVP